MGRTRFFNPEKYISNKYGKLTVIRLTEIKTYKRVDKNGKEIKSYSYLFECNCTCGKSTIVALNNLRSGKQVSCGCHKNAQTSKRNFKHGIQNKRLLGLWNAMKQRCNNPKNHAYKYYGGRGIKICDEWLEFKTFYEWAMKNGYEENLTIDRIDNDGDYCPKNCRWSNRFVQANNKRNNVFVEFNGDRKTISEWARIIGIKQPTLSNRINNLGWSIDKAFTTPVRGDRR